MASQEQAKWAFGQLVFAGLGFLAVVATVIYARKAWIAAKDAANYANEAATAAQQALRHDQTVDEVQVRPYVYLFGESVEVKPLGAGLVSDRAEVRFSIQNYGQTPAKHVKIWAKTLIGGYWSDAFPSDFSDCAEIAKADMPPGFFREMDGYAIMGVAATYRGILDGTSSIILDGRVEYEDAAGTKYETRFRRACTGDEMWKGVFFITPDGNDAT